MTIDDDSTPTGGKAADKEELTRRVEQITDSVRADAADADTPSGSAQETAAGRA